MFRAFFDIYSSKRKKKEEEEEGKRMTRNMEKRPLSSSHPRSRQVSFWIWKVYDIVYETIVGNLSNINLNRNTDDIKEILPLY